jgi:hypothetical protein
MFNPLAVFRLVFLPSGWMGASLSSITYLHLIALSTERGNNPVVENSHLQLRIVVTYRVASIVARMMLFLFNSATLLVVLS